MACIPKNYSFFIIFIFVFSHTPMYTLYICLDLYSVSWFPLESPEDLRSREIDGDIQAVGIDRTISYLIDNLRCTKLIQG